MLGIYTSAGVLIQEVFTAGYQLGSRTIITTTGSSTYTPPTWARVLIVECVGGGAGGAGTGASASGQIAMGGGGGSGGYSADILWAVKRQTYTAVVNAGGASSSGGGATSFSSDNPVAILVQAGSNGTTTGSAVATGTSEVFANAGNGAVLTNAVGSVKIAGNAGGCAHRASGTIAVSGDGAPGPWGGGAPGRTTQGTGAAGGNYGAGGAGGLSVNAGGAGSGGHGGQGVIIVWEFA